MNKIFNKTDYKQRRQTLRRNATEPEKRLWQRLRGNEMGVKFRRQHGIGHYIVDFYCPALKLVIEVDGDSHFSQSAQDYDSVRDNFMLSLGIMTIRVRNDDVMKNIDGVCQHIKHQLNMRMEVHPPEESL
jgi:very-short-patch-repair endonuclease